MRNFQHTIYKLFFSFLLFFTTNSLHAGDSCPSSDILFSSSAGVITGYTSYHQDTINDSSDADYYKVVLDSTHDISIQVRKDNDENKTKFQLLESDCSTVVSGTNENSKNYIMEKADLPAGTYYAKVFYSNADDANYKIRARIIDLTVSKTVDNPTPSIGEPITYTITGTNTGIYNTRMRIIDTLPSGVLSNINVSDNKNNFDCVLSTDTIDCNGTQRFTQNESVVVTIAADIISSGTYTNSVLINEATETRVVDWDTTNNSDSVDITVSTPSNQPPVANAGSDQTVIAGTSVTLDGSGSYDTDGIITTYRWSDGSTNWTGINPSVSTAGWSNGPHTIELTVTDNDGDTGTDSVAITIGTNESPTDITLDNNTIVEYNIIGKAIGDFSTTDPDTGDTHTYALVSGTGDSGNGSFIIEGNALKANVVFDHNDQDTYFIRVRTTDTDGGTYEKVFTINVTTASYDFSQNTPREFTKVSLDGQENTNIAGDLLVIGNQSLCKQNSEGQCIDPGADATNNAYTQKNINLDPSAATAGYLNSTSANLTILDDDVIVDAWLYWFGRIDKSNSTEMNSKSPNANRIYLKAPGDSQYTELHSQADKFAWLREKEFDYSGVVNVKELVVRGRSGTYWVADLQATNMSNQGSGWALAVVVEDPTGDNRTVKNISIYDGYTGANSSNTEFFPDEISQTLDGFRTPKVGTVNSKLIYFSAESDRGLGDRISLTKKDDTKVFLEDSKADPGNVQNATISRNAQNVTDRNPNFENTGGIDIDVIDVSNVIENNQTSTDVTIYSDDDRIFLMLYGFTTELYIPKLCYDYTLDIGGHVITSVNNEIDTPFGGFSIPLTTTIYLQSTEGDLDLTNVSVQYHINDISELSYNTNNCSTFISETGQYDYTDACPYTYNEITSGFSMYIGTGKTGTSGGVISANESRYIRWDSDFEQADVNTSFTFKANFSVDYGAGDVELSQLFTAEDLCPILTSGYLPTLGTFNVVDSRNDHDTYNLYTQVSKRPFGLTVYAYGDDFEEVYPQPGDLNLSVEVEMIRADNFSRNADTACNDQHSALTEVPSKFPHFSGSAAASLSYAAEDLDLAYRSAAMRVWYLTKDVDGVTTLINNHNCTSLQEDKSECEELYLRDYSSTDTICDTKCAIGSNWNPIDNCYSCLRTTYGRKVCSRDNFAIRPESFITEILDSNESENIDDPSNVLPTTVSGSPAHAIAGYKYRFDINATNHVDTAATPRYLQHFEPGSDIHRVRMQWYPMEVTPTANTCNDEDDKNITINIFNGSDINTFTRTSYMDKVQQIGEYRFEIFDENWTSADWDRDLLDHHFEGAYSGHFDTNQPDCIRGNSIVRAAFPIPTIGDTIQLTGCKVSSVHTNPDTGRVYDYHYTRYYPYAFSTNELNNTIGISNGNPIYINTPNATDRNMTYNIQGTFGAIGKDNILTSNFVTGCYAEDVNMDLYQNYLHDVTGLQTPSLSYDLIDFNTTNQSVIIRPRVQGNFNVINTITTTPLTPLTIEQGEQYFWKDMNGTLTMDLGYNFPRTYNTPLNPRQIRMVDFNITFVNNPSDLHVDLDTNHIISGEKNLNQDVTFLYGRTKTDLFFYEDVAASTINTPVSIVNYCNLGYTTCQNRGILAFLGQTNESDWWLSVDHNSDEGDGDITLEIGAISEGSGSPAVSPPSPAPLSILANAIDDTVIVSAGNNPSLPMTVEIDFNMDDTLSSFTNTWLIYNNSADSIPSPFFKVRFIGPSGWAGHGDTGHVVNSESNVKKNQRLGW